MRDLVLETRLAALKTNLGQVQRVLESVQERREKLNDLYGLLAHGMAAPIKRLNADIGVAILRLKLEENIDERILPDLQQAQQQTEDIEKTLRKAESIVEELRIRLVQIDKNIGETLNLALVKTAERRNGELTDVENTLKGRLGKKLPGDPTIAKRNIWQKDVGQAKEIQPIFAEYMDFLRGLALRDSGFDAGICQIADELVRLCEGVPNKPSWAFTVLAREEAVDLTLARIIRLQFPEWTIWALPLVAHEFGRLVASYNPQLLKSVTETVTDKWPQAHLQTYIADAFATYAMGPAYALAAILLRLDPVSAHMDMGEHAAEAKRAHVILTMLKWMSAQALNSQPYLDILKTLQEEWEAAVEQASPPAELDDESRRQLEEQRKGEEKQLEKWVYALAKTLKDNTYNVGYLVDAWSEIAHWPKELSEGKVEGIKPSPKQELRDLLNAAWYSRFTYPDSIAKIEPAALQLWHRITAKPVVKGERSPIGSMVDSARRGE